ncbi:MAG: ABC transporter substrate-binding protein [Pegethrix bostrychoides GSE-TBD4-15B]|uniref:ABC transporter substrate-binding protein n=1 Tax=Pegethrix bostrychoides GSE-TBD4-15B TaxID=2839662 RepID=A0A951U6D5_9CYAN|nr:ABC transporter substrate-binding protein [Pegethrix bostrychoides GSE-TBD4-15B]
MIRLVIRSRNSNSPDTDFRVRLDPGGAEELEALLPPVPPELQAALADWKRAYSGQEGVRSHYRIAAGEITTLSVREVIERSEVLRDQFNSWLSFPDKEWWRIRETLVALSHRTEPRLMIDLGQETTLKKLPWQDWDLLMTRYPRTDPALRALSQQALPPASPIYPQAAKIRILVIIGESADIQTAADLQTLETLQTNDSDHVEVIVLSQPSTRDLQTALSDAQGYHILVYVGHSRSSDDGQIGWLLLNETDELSIADFKFALKKVIQKGLQLAIFNSCDSLGLAQQLAQLDMPRCIVMKEPVPDRVAVEFIDRFFHQFVQERQPLLRSVRLARQELEHFNTRYSEVTWLPTACIKQNSEPLTWQKLLDNLLPLAPEPAPPPPTPPSPPPRSNAIKIAAAVGTMALLAGLLKIALPIISSVARSPETPSGHVAPPLPAAELISAGEKPMSHSIIELSGRYGDLKQEGMSAFANADYATAEAKFAQIRSEAKTQWRQESRTSLEFQAADQALKDPTVLIYQNNAAVRLRHKSGEPIYTIAAAVPLSLNIGQQMLFGIAQAQDRAVNPVSGAPVNLEIVVVNDLNQPSQAKAVAKSLADNARFDGRRILAVVGHYISDSTCEALREVYRAAKIPVVSPLSTAANLRQDCGDSDLFFRTTSSTAIEAEALVDYLVQSQPRPKVAIFYNKEDSFSLDLFNQFQAALNAKNGVVVQTVDLSQPLDVEAALTQVSSVDALAVLPDGRSGNPDAFNRAVEVIKANSGQRLVLGSNPLYDEIVIKTGGAIENLTAKLIIATDWYRACAVEDGVSFVKDAEEVYWFGGVNRTAALSYEAVQALQATLSPDVTSTQIQQSLTSLNGVESAVFKDKTISFDANGDRKELDSRLLTTPQNNMNQPFKLVPGTSCPAT